MKVIKGKNQSVKCTGILPTVEEVSRLEKAFSLKEEEVSFCQGLAQKIPLPDECAHKIICNGVFILLSPEEVRAALHEISRIATKGATIWIGEVPDKDEMEGKSYGNSISLWLWNVLKSQGVVAWWRRFCNVLFSYVGKGMMVIHPKAFFYVSQQDLSLLAQSYGLEVVESIRHMEIDEKGNQSFSKTRVDYLLRKI